MKDGEIVFGETHLFVGRGYVVSVRHGASSSYLAVRQRCEATPAALAHGENYILYSILDFIVDNYMPVIEVVQEEVETLEDLMLREQLTKSTSSASTCCGASCCGCAMPSCRSWTSVAAMSISTFRVWTRRFNRCFATSQTMCAGSRRISTRCVKSSPSPSKPA
ncbi:hypothetical protein AJ87_22010 [Rhizobium yanglingense]|nr:hypothetical protein AJ87_22010 [Rhizobium yanglingense]